MQRRLSRRVRFVPLFTLVILWTIFMVSGATSQDQIQKARIFQDEYPLILEADMYCSIYVLDGEKPEIKIIGAERQEEKILLSDFDTFYIDKGQADGLDVGQIFLVVEVGSPIGDFGYLVRRKGKARVVRLDEDRSVVRVEKACNPVTVGNYLIPFMEMEGVLGRDQGYDPLKVPASEKTGNIIHLESDLTVLGTGHWAIIDAGQEQGIQLGQQMTILRRLKKDLPRETLGNLVVIDVQKRTSTVKILSVRDTIEVGDEVQAK